MMMRGVEKQSSEHGDQHHAGQLPDAQSDARRVFVAGAGITPTLFTVTIVFPDEHFGEERVRSSGYFRSRDAARGRAGEDRRHRAASENSAKISGADPGQLEAGRLRRIAARSRGRIPAGAAADQITVGEVLLTSKERKKKRGAQRTRSRICGSAWTRRFRRFWITPRSRSWRGGGRNRRRATCPTGRFRWFTPTIRSASAARRWCV